MLTRCATPTLRALGIRRQGNGRFAVTVFTVTGAGAQAVGDIALNYRSAAEAETFAQTQAAAHGAHRVVVLPSARSL